MKGNSEQKKKAKERYRKRTYSGLWKRPWTPVEDIIILSSDKTDRELSIQLQRSVTAIQVRRSRINTFMKTLNLEED